MPPIHTQDQAMANAGDALAVTEDPCRAEFFLIESAEYFLAVKRKKSLHNSSPCAIAMRALFVEDALACTCAHNNLKKTT